MARRVLAGIKPHTPSCEADMTPSLKLTVIYFVKHGPRFFVWHWNIWSHHEELNFKAEDNRIEIFPNAVRVGQ